MQLRRGRATYVRVSRAAIATSMWSQCQEQADDELPLPRGEARRRDPQAPTRYTSSSPSTEAGSRCMRVTPGLGAGGGSPPPHVHGRAGDSSPPTRGQAPSSRQHKGHLTVLSGELGQRARTNSEQLLAVTRTHGEWERDPEKTHITPGSVAITSGVWPDPVTSIEPTIWGVEATCSRCWSPITSTASRSTRPRPGSSSWPDTRVRCSASTTPAAGASR